MKKSTKNILIVAVSLLAVSGATFGILQALDTTKEPTGSDTPPVTVESYLSTPKNIELSLNYANNKTEYILSWDYVTHAEKFCITVAEKEFYTTTITQQSYDISSAVTVGETYDIKVKAIGDGITYGNSENGVITETIKKVTSNLVYEELEDGTYSVAKSSGDIVIDGALVLPDTYEGKKITEISELGFQETYHDDVTPIFAQKGITSVRFPKYLKKIGNSAFNACMKLQRVGLPETVTEYGTFVFSGCVNLTSISYPTGMTVIPNSICRFCTSLKSVTLPSGLVEIGSHAFDDTGLESIDIPETVTKIGSNAFSNTKISSIDIPANIKNLDGFGYTKLTEVTIPATVETIENGAFQGCRYLQKVNFAGNDNLVAIGDFAFAYTALTEIKIPASVTSVGKGFCTGGGDTELTESSKLTNIIVEEENTAYKSIGGHLYTIDGTLLLQYAGGKTDTEFSIPDGVTTIGESAFKGSSYLKRVTIPESVALIGRSAFASISTLEYVDLPKSPIEMDSNSFGYCPSLKILKVVPGTLVHDSYSAPDYMEYLEGWTTIVGQGHTRRVVIPKSVTEIGNLFHFLWLVGGPKSSEPAWIYYKGTAEEWKEIVIRNDYIGTTNLTVYYYSETEPPINSDGTGYDGNYWYYDENGVPVVWEFEN